MLTGDIQEELYADEEIVVHRSPHPIGYVNHYVAGLILTAVSIGLMAWLADYLLTYIPDTWFYTGFSVFAAAGLVYIVGAEVYRRAHDYYVTNKRVVESYDLFSKRLESAPYNRVQDVTSYQSFIERFFDVGDVGVNTAGSEAKEIRLKGVTEPSDVKHVIMRYLSADDSGGGV